MSDAQSAEYVADEIDLCAILGHDPYWDEPNHCGRCDAQISGAGSGSQDPSDEAQQRPLRGSMPPPAPEHIDGGVAS